MLKIIISLEEKAKKIGMSHTNLKKMIVITSLSLSSSQYGHWAGKFCLARALEGLLIENLLYLRFIDVSDQLGPSSEQY